MAPRFFPSPAAFRSWLAAHHAGETELLVGFWKVGTGRPSMTWPESVDEALCFGWIDGIRRSLGEHAYCIRFTPRRPGSGWSAVNRRKAEALVAAGRMAPAGLAAWRARPARDGARSSSGPRGAARLPPAMVRRFRAVPEAWAWFSARPPGYRRTVVRWVTSARQQVTRERRLGVLIAAAAEGADVPPLRGLQRRRATRAPGRVATAPARRDGRRRG